MPITQIIWPETYWETTDGETVRLYQGHVIDVLKTLSPRSVHCVVTSPPYWGLRDYGTGEWEGGNPKCKHESAKIPIGNTPSIRSTLTTNGGKGPKPGDKFSAGSMYGYKRICPNCNAIRTDKQIGSEPIPDCETKGQAQCGKCFVCTMVSVFREVKRVLRNDGTLWLNLGDTYNSAGENRNGISSSTLDKPSKRNRKPPVRAKLHGHKHNEYTTNNLRKGNLIGIPWRVALALQYDRWILRGDNIWAKPNPMPESVTNRCTKSHEYLFLFTKTDDYYFDMQAIRDKGSSRSSGNKTQKGAGQKGFEIRDGFTQVSEKEWEQKQKRSVWSIEEESTLLQWLQENDPETLARFLEESKNKKDVWPIASYAYPGSHFATFPPKLVEPCILAGTSEKGCCSNCHAPWERVTEGKLINTEGWGKQEKDHQTGLNNPQSMIRNGQGRAGNKISKTIGWKPTCNCQSELEPIPCTVLDPFVGSGTTSCVSIKHERRSVGIDLSIQYLNNNCIPRISSELNLRPYTRNLVPIYGQK